ncbi:MAG: phosphate signaling complex protein PhoU [Verrucomicrobia bacterium]|nr:phosphate signaling complex protein PhoU [Verrucomicrobiota bacterium]
MTDGSHHILRQFEADLQKLRADVLTMGSRAQENLRNAVNGLINRDVELCNRAIVEDEDVDKLEIEIDHEGMMIIAKYSPVARNLRRVVSTMKVSQNLERLSDQASNIAKRGRKIAGNAEIPETASLQLLFDLVSGAVRDSLEAFTKGDVKRALTFDDRDEEIDRIYKELSKKITKRLEEDSSHTKDYVDLLFIIRFLERVGDYAVNIAEDAVYSESAVDIRHGRAHPDVS